MTIALTMGGIKGPRGSDGPQGPAGQPGQAGQSAYEVAVSNGFPGTESEWLASIKGADGAPGDPAAEVLAAYDIAMIGDSRIVGFNSDYCVTVLAPAGVPSSPGNYVQFLGAMGDADKSAVGSYEYDHSTVMHRWSLASDGFGPWMPATVGRHLLESGVPGRALRLMIWRPLSSSFTTSITLGTVLQHYFGGSVLNRHWLPPGIMSEFAGAKLRNLGAGGSRTADAVYMLPYYEAQSPGSGVDVWWSGTNDISNNVPASEMIANAFTVFDARIQLGRNIVILGEHARWGANTSTPMTETQISIHIEYNAGLKQYANANKSRCRFIDTLALTMDAGYSDLRPQAGVIGANDMLFDVVHPWLGASFAVLPPTIAAIRELMIPQARTPISKSDASVIDFAGTSWFPGVGGTVSGAVTSTTGVPDMISVGQSANVASSWNKTAFKSEPGVAMECVYNSTPGTTQYTRALSASYALANLGLAVFDYVEFESLVEIDKCSVGDKFRIYATFTGSTGSATIAEMDAPSVPGVFRLRTSVGQIPSGTTSILFRIECYTDTVSNSSGVFRFGKFVARKIAA